MKKRKWRTPSLIEVTPHVPVTLERLVAALGRDSRIAALGIGHLQDKTTKQPRHRPKTITSPLWRDEIAQAVALYRALCPKMKDKEIISKIQERYTSNYKGKGYVSRAYVYRILKELEPQRWKEMEAFAAALLIDVLDHEKQLK